MLLVIGLFFFFFQLFAQGTAILAGLGGAALSASGDLAKMALLGLEDPRWPQMEEKTRVRSGVVLFLLNSLKPLSFGHYF